MLERTPDRPPQEAQGGQARPIPATLLALLLGSAGFATNLLFPLSVSWGVHLLFGGCIALVATRILPLRFALAATLLATLPTFFIWGHGFAVVISCGEALWLCAMARRGRGLLWSGIVF